jgi:hypothetical protein
MKVTHRLEIRAKCPANQSEDTYQLTVLVSRVLLVEDILATVEKLTQEPIYQEILTVNLAQALSAQVTTRGWHSGVQTECEA